MTAADGVPLWQVWLGRADALAQAAVTAEICGFDRAAPGAEAGQGGLSVPGLRLVLMGAAAVVWQWPSRVDALGERFDAGVAERRRIEAVLALGPAGDPRSRRTGLFATDGCSAAERARIAALAALMAAEASDGPAGGGADDDG